MSQHAWTTEAIQDGLKVAERYADITWYIACALSYPLYKAIRHCLYGRHPPRQSHAPLMVFSSLVAITGYTLAFAIASAGLRYTIPSTNIGFTIVHPVLPNQCTPELYHLEPDSWPCIRDGALGYVQRVMGRRGWQHIRHSEPK
ncbi:hypothetical protein CLAFUW4_10118 [Fulvia fulva]|uniref:Uncharacterized protein n=1 Tax=Passalora fulva TaxID=5499 RepID=A0A9Q8P7L6_PASFU|nr:uncharacterized protein CLAFUR5_04732 [Fulvia fulva]KAK4615928.1 hypothetical protein CLAFUR4_10122 [Fulvia fulva]KAK4617209.1 hypothetical protein CLAFUR0_10120 [Fulvia fulva]UJO16275.1 hypothetical protein CLAFUR5_04732 [Fulvia fulva]WPV18932.1 hypothetical protein CLAFUW4_10118 [Fulvia fulva]WPV33842.1 hypothetical protein CLAFUW7_10119 [Fulvia fulva]